MPTLVLQPGPGEGKEAQGFFNINQNTSLSPLEGGTEISVRVGTFSSNSRHDRAFIEFDLSEIPLGSEIISASLRLYTTAGDLSQIRIESVTSPWDIGTMAPTIIPTTGSYSNPSGTNFWTLDIAPFVKRWIEEGEPNYGLRISGFPEDVNAKNRTFALSNNPTPDFRPRLEIEYIESTPGESLLPSRFSILGNLRFRDPATGDYFSKADRTITRPLDAGQVFGGRHSEAHEVILENRSDFALTEVKVWVERQTGDDVVQLSKTDEPFSPEVLPLHFPGVHSALSDIGSFFIRVQTDQDSTGSPQVLIKCSGKPIL